MFSNKYNVGAGVPCKHSWFCLLPVKTNVCIGRLNMTIKDIDCGTFSLFLVDCVLYLCPYQTGVNIKIRKPSFSCFKFRNLNPTLPNN